MIAIAANCAEPANTIAEKTIAAIADRPGLLRHHPEGDREQAPGDRVGDAGAHAFGEARCP